MQKYDYTSLLGLYFGEKALTDFLLSVGITKRPKIPRDDTSTIVEGKSSGLELTFEEEEFLETPLRDYPDGAMVLTSIRFNGTRTDECEISPLELPHGLKFGMNREAILQLLGTPQLVDDELDMFRWDFAEQSGRFTS